MPTKFKVFAIAAALAAGMSGAAMAQYACPPGSTYYSGVCQPVAAPGYSNPVSGTVSGETAGAARGIRPAVPSVRSSVARSAPLAARSAAPPT